MSFLNFKEKVVVPIGHPKKDIVLKENMHVLLTEEEKNFIISQSREECTSQNSIIRKAINLYKKKTALEQQ